MNERVPYVTKSELETPRTAADIKIWAEAKIMNIRKTTNGINALHRGVRLLKELTEEALPLGVFCERFYNKSQHVIVQHVIGEQNFDAKVEDSRVNKSPLKYIEITQAHEGEDRHSRMLYLEKEGHVSVFGKVVKTGTQRTGAIIEVEAGMLEQTELISNEIRRIDEAVSRKSSKQYPPNTGLVIMFDDCIGFDSQQVKEQLSEHAQENYLAQLSNFHMVFLVGWFKNVFLEFEPINKANKASGDSQ